MPCRSRSGRSSADTPPTSCTRAATSRGTATQLHELNLGATAVGTGLNAGDRVHASARSATSRSTPGSPSGRRQNRFRVTQSMGDVLAFSGALRRLAVEVNKVASDLRLLSMGPRAGIAEIQLPPVQPGSSIMPGKVNPSVPEMVNQVCFQVYGCDAAILAACDAGQLELNVMMPVIAWNALHATRILTNAMRVLQARCVVGHPRRRGSMPRAARPQHRAGDRAQPVHRLRGNRRHRQDVCPDRTFDPGARARAEAPARRPARCDSVAGSDDVTRRPGRSPGPERPALSDARSAVEARDHDKTPAAVALLLILAA